MSARRRAGESTSRIALGMIAVAGLGVSGYLTAIRASGDTPACVIGGGCTTVQKSEYSELAGIPVAALGLLAYAGLLVAAILPGPLGRALGLFTAVVSVGFSAWLTYAELFIIEAVCAWCVTSAVLVTLALALAVWRLVQGAREDSDGGGSAHPSAPDRQPPEPSPGATRG